MFECLFVPLMVFSPVLVGWSLQLVESIFSFLCGKFEGLRKVEAIFEFNAMKQIPYVLTSLVLTFVTTFYKTVLLGEGLIASFAKPEAGFADEILKFYIRMYLWLVIINIVVWLVRKTRYWLIPIVLGLGALIFLFIKFIL